jgi:DnaA-homolog protein
MGTQLALGLSLRDSSRFANYVAGGNAEQAAALQSLRVGELPTVAWLHGPMGTGKTHLLQALCARAGEQSESAGYLPLADLMSHGPEVLQGAGRNAWLCIDDIDHVLDDTAGQDEWERALFGVYGEIEDHRGHLVIASRAPPAGLAFHLPDLASRMSGGLVLRLARLGDDDMRDALQLRAQLRGLELSEDVAEYIWRRMPRELPALCDLLDLLDRESLAAQRRLSVSFVGSVLDGGTTGA